MVILLDLPPVAWRGIYTVFFDNHCSSYEFEIMGERDSIVIS